MSRLYINKINSEKILLKLWNQCENEELCDVVLIAGNEKKRIPAHRNILSAASDFLERMLASPMESTSKEVAMSGESGDILKSLVEYIYTGRIKISEDNVVELLQTAHMLLLTDVVEACADTMKEQLCPSNWFGFYLLAELYECEKLLQSAKDYSLKNFMQICEEGGFLQLEAKQLMQLMASDDLCVDTEENVLNSLLEWIDHERSEREQHKVELLKLVRMPLLEQSFLTKHVKPICTTTECLQIYIEAIEWQLAPEINVFSENKFTKPRRSDQFLMAITQSKPDKEMFIHYYCPQRNKWKKWFKDLKYRTDFGFAVMENDILIAGGKEAMGNILNTVICFDLNTMTLKKIPPMLEKRSFCRSAVLNGCLYVVGGENAKGLLSSAEKYDPKANKWKAVASMLVNRANIGIAVLNQKLYVVGGVGNGIELSSTECYDPMKNAWQSMASMNEGRQLPGIAVANGLLYAVGGINKNTVERYDPEANKWSVVCSLNQGMRTYSFRCTTLRDKVVVCYNDYIEVYNSATNEWKKIVSFKSLNIYNIFSYSDKLLTAEFIEN